MKRFFLITLSLLIVLSGCASAQSSAEAAAPVSAEATASPTASPTPSPVPTATPEPVPMPLSFTFDRYKLPADLTEYLAETGITEDWKRLVDAVYGQKTALYDIDPATANNLAAVFAASPYAALADITYTDGQLEIVCTGAGSPEALESAVEDMVENVLFEESNALETYLALYRAVSSGFQYEESESSSLYRMLVENKGEDKEFAAALQYLFTQADIPAYLAQGSTGDFSHRWVIAELDGVLYHFDPVFENSATAGLGLSYFGMSDEAHQAAGCSADYTTGFGFFSSENDALCPDPLLSGRFTEVTDWQNDLLSHQLTLAYRFESEFSTSLSTETPAAE